jgi:alpha-ketoglutarate-dependent taurine dioxygenase
MYIHSGLFETCPSDFSFLRMESTPPAGGDTLWVSGYELYDRLSPPYQKFLETLTATCAQPVFKSACESGGYPVMSPRGSPLNVDYEFQPVHPVIRTHPVTGWKSLFAGVGLHVSRINDVTTYEDSMIRDYVLRLITRNHDCVARMHWTRGACAIWSNECTLHAATVSACRLCTPFTPHRANPHSCSPTRTLWKETGPACGLPAPGVCRISTRTAKVGGKRWGCPSTRLLM